MPNNSKITPIILSQESTLPAGAHTILTIGCAGSGKNRSYVLPNLLQCAGSYIVTDPFNELRKATEKQFREQGYTIKTLDARTMTEADIEAFDAASVGETPTAVYITMGCTPCNNDEAISNLIEKIQKAVSQSAKIPVHFILDEFCNIGNLPNLPTWLSQTQPESNLYYSIIIQSISQLQSAYKPDNTWQEIASQADTILFPGGHDYQTLEYLSDILGNYLTTTYGIPCDKTMSEEIIRAFRNMNTDDCFMIFTHGEQEPKVESKYDPIQHPNYTSY